MKLPMTNTFEKSGVRHDETQPQAAITRPYAYSQSNPGSLAASETVAVRSEESNPTRSLMHRRLRLLCILGFGGWSFFDAVVFGGLDPVFRLDVIGMVCAAILFVVTIAPLISVLILFARPTISERWLTAIELHLIFLCAATMAGLRFTTVEFCLTAAGTSSIDARVAPVYAAALNNLLLLCCVVVFGVVVPSRWQRTLTVVAGLTCAALMAEVVARITQFPSGNDSLPSAAMMTCLTLFIGVGVTVFGSYRIGRLEGQVNEARRLLRELGPYKLVRRLGGGGMGEVYLAQHRLLKRPCAVKLIRSEKATEETFIRRFEREVQAATRLAHQSAVQIYDYGREADGTFYYVMEYLPGFTLEDAVRNSGPMHHGRVIDVLRQVCGALAEAHGLGLIHRDVKPGNVMLCRLGGRVDAVKLLDFGLVADTDSSDTRLTQSGGILGTPAYMSPEQARGAHDLGPASDLYSLGAVAYFLLTGRPPFVSPNSLELLHAHLTASVTPPSVYNPNVPSDLASVVLRLLAKQPADRFADAVTTDRALAGCDRGDWTDAKAADWWELACSASADFRK